MVASGYSDVENPPPVYVGPTSSVAMPGSNTSFDITPHVSAVVGDLIVVLVFVDGTVAAPDQIVPPAGWTTIVQNGPVLAVFAFHGVHDGSASYTFTRPGSTVSLVAFGGVFAEAVVDTYTTDELFTSSPYGPSITPTDEAMLIVAWGSNTSDYNAAVPVGFRAFPVTGSGALVGEGGHSIDTYPGGIATGNIPCSANFVGNRTCKMLTLALRGSGIPRSTSLGVRTLERATTWTSSNQVTLSNLNSVPGELLLAVVCTRVDEPFTPPSGWVLLADDIPTSSVARGRVYYRIVDGTETSTFQWTWTTVAKVSAVMWLVSGCHPTTPIDTVGTVSKGFGSPVVADSISVVSPNALLLAIGWCDNNNMWTVTAPLTLVVTSTTTNFEETSVGVGEQLLSASGPTGTRTLNPANSFWCAMLAAIAPEP